MRAESNGTIRHILCVFPRYTSSFGTFEHSYPLTDGVRAFMPPQGLLLLAAAGVTFIMGVPGADDVMLNYQSTSFHDALYVRDVFGLKRAPEFDDWLLRAGLAGNDFRLADGAGLLPEFASRLIA